MEYLHYNPQWILACLDAGHLSFYCSAQTNSCIVISAYLDSVSSVCFGAIMNEIIMYVCVEIY